MIRDDYPDLEVYQNSSTLTNFIDNSYSPGNFLNGDYPFYYPINIDFMKEWFMYLRSNTYYSIDEHGSHIHDYNGTEDISGVYAMAALNIGEDLTLLPGIRYQNLTTDYFANRGRQVPGGFQYTNIYISSSF